jgi:multidrug efflux pump subunit AcrB
MGWNLSAWAIRAPVPAVLIFVFLCLVGLLGFQRLDVQDMPNIDLPAVTVTVALPGASPAQLESEVTRKIEDSIASAEGVKHIVSTITDGLSTSVISFVIEKDVTDAVDDVRDAVTRVRDQLPRDIEEPVVARISVAGAAILTYAVKAPQLDERELSWFIDGTIAKQLLGVPGVARVGRIGGVEREVRVELDPLKLAAFGVSAADISRALQRAQREVPGGRGNLGAAEQSVRTLGAATSVEALGALRVTLPRGGTVRLDEVAVIRDAHAERRQLALLDGQPIVGIEVFRSRGAGEVRVGEATRARIAELAAKHPEVQFAEVSNTTDQVSGSYQASMNALWEGALLAVLVVWWFLRDYRATLVSALALPLSIIPTFGAMWLAGFTLNSSSLLALALVVGILVDDAIVEVENIERHLRMGKSPLKAALEAADEIGLAVIATSLTLVAVFVPTAFMAGIPGRFFREFGWTAGVAVLVSLLVARLLTPMMAAYLLTPTVEVRHDTRLEIWYLALVRKAMAHRRITVVGATLFFVASLGLMTLLPSSFLPAADKGRTSLSVELPPGSTIEDTRQAAEAARLAVQRIPEVRSVYAAVGAAMTGNFDNSLPADIRRATLTVDFGPENERHRSQQALENNMREVLQSVPGARFAISTGEPGEKLDLMLAGDDPEMLTKAAAAVEREMRSLGSMGNLRSSASLVRPEIQVRTDAELTARLGVDTVALGDVTRVATAGDFQVALAKFDLPDRQIPIRVALPEAARDSLEMVRQLRVPTASGPVPLGTLATVTEGSGPAQISRVDRSRDIIISGELGGEPIGPVLKQVKQLPSVRNLPAGIREVPSGDAEILGELFASFILAMFAGVFFVYAILVLLFHDFLQPITILAALPLSIGGAFGALVLTGTSLSMPALIGLLMLMGIATKNSILLVEYAIVARRDHGFSRSEALIDACHKRARPIVMTSLAMGAGMLPIALGVGVDSSFRAPMGVAVIGGLITSTVLSLVVVPAVFTYVDDIAIRLRGLRKRFSRSARSP